MSDQDKRKVERETPEQLQARLANTRALTRIYRAAAYAGCGHVVEQPYGDVVLAEGGAFVEVVVWVPRAEGLEK